MSQAYFRGSRERLAALALALAWGCVRVLPMPPLPDLGQLQLSAADSVLLARAAMGDGALPVKCFDPLRDDTTGITRPVRIGGSTDVYPSAARKQGLQGWVAMTFIIDTLGSAE